jgi:hypothetical protein
MSRHFNDKKAKFNKNQKAKARKDSMDSASGTSEGDEFGNDERMKEIDMEIDQEIAENAASEDNGIDGEEFDETKALDQLGEDLDLPSEKSD